jgi:hypothetical protein
MIGSDCRTDQFREATVESRTPWRNAPRISVAPVLLALTNSDLGALFG